MSTAEPIQRARKAKTNKFVLILEQFLERYNLSAKLTTEQLSEHTSELNALLSDWKVRRDAIRNPKIRIIRQSIQSEWIMDASGWIKDIHFNPKQHPKIVERCTIAHSNRLNATIRMSYSAFLHDPTVRKRAQEVAKSEDKWDIFINTLSLGPKGNKDGVIDNK
ncbi:hypothetical protein RhiirC2_802196 [Rhizophagus irregularis]|uniref:Uncharacterized protein n=1 Tax=Rhizophagus irregularis TaxID=588596 RepID=A0A2N1M1J7_9GLOM|nr:hypothetical protein RhiirC2_802196 [Rhizophagus irregularis]